MHSNEFTFEREHRLGVGIYVFSEMHFSRSREPSRGISDRASDMSHSKEKPRFSPLLHYICTKSILRKGGEIKYLFKEAQTNDERFCGKDSSILYYIRGNHPS